MTIERGGRQVLLHGLAMIFAGLLFGFLVPQTRYPRLAVGAHNEFETNGLLFIATAIILLKLPHRVGPKSMWVILLSAWLTWTMALSEAANAWWGTTQLLSVAGAQAGATGGKPWQELVVKLTHIGAGFSLIATWVLVLVGFVKPAPAE